MAEWNVRTIAAQFGDVVSMLKIIQKRRNVFINHLLEQAHLTFEGVSILDKYMAKPNETFGKKLKIKEKMADKTRRSLIDELNRTFLTPYDREDIFALSRAIDDLLDYTYSSITEIIVMKVEPTKFMQLMCGLLKDGAAEILLAIERLQDYPGVASEHIQRAKAIENKVEILYREALADMFKQASNVKKVMKILKLREIYRHLSNAADRADEAANYLANILVKNT